MFDVLELTFILVTFLLAGGVKGVIGLGLPTVSLGLLVTLFDLPTSMTLLIIPSCLTNFWQAAIGGKAVHICKKHWTFFLCASLTIWIGGKALPIVNHAHLTFLLGCILIAYGLLHWVNIRFQIEEKHHVKAGIIMGSINGVLTGMTGSFVVPGVIFLQLIGLKKDELIQAMGILFSLSTIGLALNLQHHSYIDTGLTMLSTIAVIPAIAGMSIGKIIRQRIKEESFRRIFFSSILVLGAAIMVKSIIT